MSNNIFLTEHDSRAVQYSTVLYSTAGLFCMTLSLSPRLRTTISSRTGDRPECDNSEEDLVWFIVLAAPDRSRPIILLFIIVSVLMQPDHQAE